MDLQLPTKPTISVYWFYGASRLPHQPLPPFTHTTHAEHHYFSFIYTPSTPTPIYLKTYYAATVSLASQTLTVWALHTNTPLPHSKKANSLCNILAHPKLHSSVNTVPKTARLYAMPFSHNPMF
jgi:hypothetical protein